VSAGPHPSHQRVGEALRAAGIDAEVRELSESTRTAQEAAAALGVDVAQISKTLVFLADGIAVVVVASGVDRVDTGRLSEALDGAAIGRADADAVRAATGYPIGGVSPAALPEQLIVLVDDGLREQDPVWAAAGTPRAVYRTTYGDLLKLTGGRPVAVAVAPG
jgi:prolyl-tRNA editing enzyme YbaK/EbsC (Cys-tRNA(Pro) deacylase)